MLLAPPTPEPSARAAVFHELASLRPPREQLGRRGGWSAWRRAPGSCHCVLRPGDSIYIPCNWHHSTLNVAETLAFGGQAEPAAALCDADADATAEANFAAAQASSRGTT